MAEQFTDDFIRQISLLNPSTNVTDENANLPHLELQHNLNYILNTLKPSYENPTQLLSMIYGNLLDYDKKGKKVFHNGGKFDCFEKKQFWLAINDGKVVNDTAIQTVGADNLLVYKDGKSYVDTTGQHGIWLERSFFIPKPLRGTTLVFAIKATGVNTPHEDKNITFTSDIPFCNDSSVPNISSVGEIPCLVPVITGISGCGTYDFSSNCYAKYEDIGIEVIGTDEDIQEIKVVGPWPHHEEYAKYDEWKPQFRTSYITFNTSENTESITIRIRRTTNDGSLAISNMFLGGLPQPFDSYSMQQFDINELYDFVNGITKWNVTTVNGKHVGQIGSSKINNILTIENWLHLQQFTRNIEEFDYDAINGPRQNELEFGNTEDPFQPKLIGLEFDPEFTRYINYDMRVDGPNPGKAYIGITYTVNENEFSETNTCSTPSLCGNVRIAVRCKVINAGQYLNPTTSSYTTFEYDLPITKSAHDGNLHYFEIYGDFYQQLSSSRGSIVHFVLSREGENAADTYTGNFVIIGAKTGIAIPPDDAPMPNTYTNLFVGEIEDC